MERCLNQEKIPEVRQGVIEALWEKVPYTYVSSSPGPPGLQLEDVKIVFQ